MREKRIANFISSLMAVIVLFGALALFFDFYYDLNDDVMIKDIISGIYTGTPDAHNNQMLYPVSLIFAGLYRAESAVPWFGLIEMILMALSFFITLKSLLLFTDIKSGNLYTEEPDNESKTRIIGFSAGKIAFAVSFTIIYAALMIWELVNVQYTVVAGMLTAAAAIRLYCGDPVGVSDEGEDRSGEYHVTPFEMKTFIRMNIPSIILTVIAFNIRSELVLLLSPLLAAVAIAKWSEERCRDKAFVICAYLGVFLCICTLMAGSLSIDGIAYGSSGWDEYRDFFDARTDVYDFTGVPDYESNREFYTAEGITEEQVTLLTDYNYYLDDSIDTAMLEKIATGVREGRASGRNTFDKSIREAAWEYIHNMLDIMSTNNGQTEHIFADEAGQHRPYNIIIIVLYIALIAAGIVGKDSTVLIKIPSLAVLRTIPWMYIYLQGRVLSRITHPLYLIEIMFLIAMIINEQKERTEGKNTDKRPLIVLVATLTVISAVCIISLPDSVRYIASSQNERAAANVEGERLYAYTSSDMDTYYYIDTYSTVDQTEKIFGRKAVTKKNTQALGGWMGNSPLDAAKKSRCISEEIITKEKYLALTAGNK